ncbi:MAG: hypothetical protein ACE5FJ_08800 [Gemmatimonadales bacterium]
MTREITELRFEFRPGTVGETSYSFDRETGILSAAFGGPDHSTVPGTLELADRGGGIIYVQQEHGVLCGVEVVVWPFTDRDVDLDVPEASGEGVLHPSKSDGEVTCDALASVSRDGSSAYLELGDDEACTTVAVSHEVFVDLDASMSLSGIWFTRLPAGIGGEIGSF